MASEGGRRAYSLLRRIPLWSGATLIAPPVSLAFGGLTLTTTLTLSAECENSRQGWNFSRLSANKAVSAGRGLDTV